MEVFLIRHAAAVDETLELRDPLRHLTAEGREQARQLGDRLRWHDCHPTHLWTSPLVRAVQTAELVATGLQIPIAVETLPQLAPGESLRDVKKALDKLPRDAHVVLVGHEPGISGLGELLIGGDLAALQKAEAVRIIDGKLRWRFAWNAEAPDR
ncbi:MAG: phosphohistidine phosphatase SixA [Deltaproteobacteria bacterium]|nr:phosphohistidine phosphatase SixA [Deltaproteobacteria bacterium]